MSKCNHNTGSRNRVIGIEPYIKHKSRAIVYYTYDKKKHVITGVSALNVLMVGSRSWFGMSFSINKNRTFYLTLKSKYRFAFGNTEFGANNALSIYYVGVCISAIIR